MDELLQLANATSLFGVNPDDSEEFIIDDSVAVEMHPLAEDPNYIHFVSIRALNPEKGHGSKAMKKVLELASKNNITLIGRVIPYHTKNMSKEKLCRWYKKLGCEPVDPNNEDGLWVRAPYGGRTPIKIGLLTKIRILNGYSEEDFLGRKLLLYIMGIGLMLFCIKLK